GGRTFSWTIADTTVIESRYAVTADTVICAELFQSAALEQPFAVVAAGRYLVVGDRQAVHILSNDGAFQESLDGAGEGPGEFRSVSAIGAWAGDSIGVYDARLNRLSIFPKTLDN